MPASCLNLKKSHTCEAGGADLLMNFEKPEKKQNLNKNEKKNAGDIIILHVCTKNYD